MAVKRTRQRSLVSKNVLGSVEREEVMEEIMEETADTPLTDSAIEVDWDGEVTPCLEVEKGSR